MDGFNLNFEKSKGEIELKEITRNLKVLLTDDEKLNLMKQMVEITNDRALAEDKLKSVSDELKGAIKSKNAEHDRIAHLVHEGWEYRNVDCEEQRDEPNKEIAVFRTDTWEQVSRRPMTQEELQAEFKFEGVNEPTSEQSVAGFFASNEGEKEAIKPRRIDFTSQEEYAKAFDEWLKTAKPEDGDEADSLEFENRATGETASHSIVTTGTPIDKKRVKEHVIPFDADLEFGAVLKIGEDAGTFMHFGYRLASTGKPKASIAIPVVEESRAYDEEAMLKSDAARAMIQTLNSHDKFRPMGVERAKRIIAQIEEYCGVTAAVAGA